MTRKRANLANPPRIVIIELTYLTDDLSKIDALMDDHMAFIDAQYEAGLFIASGPKVPRVGGVILADGNDVGHVTATMELDPFKIAGVADYSYTTFVARRKDAEAFAAI